MPASSSPAASGPSSPTADNAVDLAVIGAGPGGYAAAFLAADMGLQVAVIDPEHHPGGVCLYRGCIPSKALLHVARLLHETQAAEAWGVSFGKPAVNLKKLRAWKDSVVSQLTSGLGALEKQRKVRHIQGLAIFTSATTLAIQTAGKAGATSLTFRHAIIATGSSPTRLPMLPEDDRIMDSTAALDLPDIPGRLLVIGGGYIGLELGSVYAALSSKVTVVEMTGALLPGVDTDLVRPLATRLEKDLEEILLNTKVTGARATAKGMQVTLEGKNLQRPTRTFDRILVAIGRRPNSSDLGLEKTRVALDEAGFVAVDAQRRTAEPTIFAIGDVAGQPMLAHKAAHEARTAVEAIVGHKSVFAPRAIPAVVFTDPEIAWCGITEAEAREQKLPVEVVRFPWAASGRAATLGRSDGVTKLIIDTASERILGVGLAGPGAGELIAEGVLALEMAARARDLSLTIHPHPTLSETLMEAAEVFFGQATHTYRPRRPAAGKRPAAPPA